MSEPAQKCENNAIFNQIYTVKLLIAFRLAYSFYFVLNLQIPAKNSFITSTTGLFSDVRGARHCSVESFTE